MNAFEQDDAFGIKPTSDLKQDKKKDVFDFDMSDPTAAIEPSAKTEQKSALDEVLAQQFKPRKVEADVVDMIDFSKNQNDSSASEAKKDSMDLGGIDNNFMRGLVNQAANQPTPSESAMAGENE